MIDRDTSSESSAERVALCPSSPPTYGNYFVATYPPFSAWSDERLEYLAKRLAEKPGTETSLPLGLYVHVPFCEERCRFCYYLSYDRRPEAVEAYLDALGRELALYRRSPYLAGRHLSFVYFGGGTPSLLSRARLQRLFASLTASFDWQRAEEITFEGAPRSLTLEKLELLRESGITRLSMGVQQLDDEVLRQNGRIHLVRDVERAYEAIRRVGFPIVNLDLMVGLVGETDRSFEQSLEKIIGMAPESVTLYQMEIPLNTPLYRDAIAGAAGLPGWEVKRQRLAGAFERLEAAGYEVATAYAAVRDRTRHRFVYQQEQYRGCDLLGIGAASFSYLGGVHQQNLASLDAYLARLAEDRLPWGRAYVLDPEETFVRELVLQLKLGACDTAKLSEKLEIDLPDSLRDPLREWQERGCLTMEGDVVRLTRRGLVRADEILPSFYLPRHRGARYS